MKPRRRVFGRGYASKAPSGRYSSQHQRLAKVVTMNATCAWVDRGGCDGPLEADHIVPRIEGGESSRENLRPLCRRHNRQRGIETKKRMRK
jgi:5-methylcytosine-specific restriction endonuclease McrA